MNCSFCGSDNLGRSPTGDWCNNCGHSMPCPCWAGDNHAECIEYMNEFRRKSGYPLATKCCCEESKEAA